MIQVEVDYILLQQPKPLQHCQIAAEADGDGRKDDMEGNGEAKLDASQQKRIKQRHLHSVSRIVDPEPCISFGLGTARYVGLDPYHVNDACACHERLWMVARIQFGFTIA